MAVSSLNLLIHPPIRRCKCYLARLDLTKGWMMEWIKRQKVFEGINYEKFVDDLVGTKEEPSNLKLILADK